MAARKTAKKKAPSKAAGKAKSAKAKGDGEEAAKSAGGEAQKGATGEARAADVNMARVFALRPRVPSSFSQARFLEARRLLDDETYESAEAATRAVVEKALELTNKPAGKRDRGPARR